MRKIILKANCIGQGGIGRIGPLKKYCDSYKWIKRQRELLLVPKRGMFDQLHLRLKIRAHYNNMIIQIVED